jgi:hypothetical protein
MRQRTKWSAAPRRFPELKEPEEIAAAIAQEIGREVDYLPVETDGAARAPAAIAELLSRCGYSQARCRIRMWTS